MRRLQNDPGHARLRKLAWLGCLAFALLALRALQLTLVDERGAQRFEAQTGAVLKLAPARGTLFDRGGTALAVTVRAPSVSASRAQVEDVEATARSLAPVLQLPVDALRRRLQQPSSTVFLARWVQEDTARAVQRLALPGVALVQEPRRAYPLGALAGRIVGFTNIDGQGVRGIEQAEDDWLRGNEQRVTLERDGRRRLLPAAGVDLRSAAGGDVRLALDSTLQAELENALTEIVQKTGALGGMVLALDPAHGDLLGAAEFPGLDPNAFRSLDYRETRSRIFLDALEPGSTFKPLLVAAALAEGKLDAEETIDCTGGELRVMNKTLRDREDFGPLDPAGILRVSSNVGIVQIALRMDPRTHHQALQGFGFGHTTQSGFPSESSGLLRGHRHWMPLDQANIAFGQGVNVTAAQLAAAFTMLANDGMWRAPRLVQARRKAGDAWRENPPLPAHRVLGDATARRVREMMRSVVSGERGTGRRAALVDVSVSGKTGTAQKLEADGAGYSHERLTSWFVGMAPADAPRVVVVAMVDEPRGEARGGGAVAAPLFARAAAAALTLQGFRTAPRFDLPASAHFKADADGADADGGDAGPLQAGRTERAGFAVPGATPGVSRQVRQGQQNREQNRVPL